MGTKRLWPADLSNLHYQCNISNLDQFYTKQLHIRTVMVAIWFKINHIVRVNIRE